MTSQVIAPTARCVHCAWTTHTPRGDDLQEVRDIHELIHPVGTVLVGDEERTARGTPVIETHSVRASERWKPSGSNGRSLRMAWTREEAIAALQAFCSEHGRTPRQPELRAPLPSSSTLSNLFGSMGEAVRAAGFEPRPKGGGRSRKPAVPPPGGRAGWTRRGTQTAPDSARARSSAGFRGNRGRDTCRACPGGRPVVDQAVAHAR